MGGAGAGVHRDDLRVARRAHHARLPGPVERRAARRLEAHRRLRARAARDAKIAMQLGHAGAKGSTRVPWEGEDQPLARGQLAADLGLAAAVPRRRQRLVAGDDARRHGPRARRLRRAPRAAPPRPASTGSSCTARTATCCRRSSRRSPTSAPTSTAARWRTGCAIRSRCSARCARSGRTQLPMSVRISAHDWVEGGITPDDAVEIARAVQGRRRRPDRLLVGPGRASGRSRSTAACTRRRSPTASATRPASRRWRSARSPRPTTSTASSPPAAPTCARSPGRISPTRPGRCSRRRSIGYTEVEWPKQYRSAKTQLERNLERERQMAAQGAGLSALEQANKALGV